MKFLIKWQLLTLIYIANMISDRRHSDTVKRVDTHARPLLLPEQPC